LSRICHIHDKLPPSAPAKVALHERFDPPDHRTRRHLRCRRMDGRLRLLLG
jgi:hypothetical protein